ncbi:MAG TPA: hypothetical protein VK600_01310 [Candidatus Saccharimonadales bacterium]|nr:hypothetical protein [Candidatus Saccharimonadales bacterium]
MRLLRRLVLVTAFLLAAAAVPVRAAVPVDGWASEWQGPGAATHDCVWPWRDCAPRSVQSLRTGLVIIVTPTMWCDCHVAGAAHPDRLIDLDPAMVRALGLDPADGLFEVSVQIIGPISTLPNTATAP